MNTSSKLAQLYLHQPCSREPVVNLEGATGSQASDWEGTECTPEIAWETGERARGPASRAPMFIALSLRYDWKMTVMSDMEGTMELASGTGQGATIYRTERGLVSAQCRCAAYS